jgi:hypothetical protein
VFVQLIAPTDELQRRVSDASRAAHGKIRDAASLAEVLRDHDVYAPIPGRESLTIDTAATSPEEAALRVREYTDALLSDDDCRS